MSYCFATFLLLVAQIELRPPRSAPANTSGPTERALSGLLSAASYPTIQQALDANPGKMVFLPARDYVIDQALVIRTDDGGLFGPGRILQTKPRPLGNGILGLFGHDWESRGSRRKSDQRDHKHFFIWQGPRLTA